MTKLSTEKAAVQIRCIIMAPRVLRASASCGSMASPSLRLHAAGRSASGRVAGRGPSLRCLASREDGGAAPGPEYSRSKPLKSGDELDNWTPSTPGVYAVFNEDEELQYVGLSRKISSSIQRHAETVLPKMHSAHVFEMPGADKESLQSVWKGWIEAHVEETGNIPVGNRRGEGQWLLKQPARAKDEIKLTPGKGAQDLAVPMEALIDSLVKAKKVVAFIKGTRTQPECGFSHQVLLLLNQSRVDYETVNVLDEFYNPGLREAIKVYSDWPTIPQVYANGEFIGGADIITEMSENGELVGALTGKQQ